MKIIIGIDPGPEKSGAVVMDHHLRVHEAWSQLGIDGLLNLTSRYRYNGHCYEQNTTLVIEGVSPRASGSPGQVYARWGTTIRVAKIVGYMQRLSAENLWNFSEILPATWRAQLCGTAGAGDPMVKACIREVYEQRGLALGGGKQPAVGVKKKPGPLYIVKGHAWDALGVAIAHLQQSI